MPGDEELAHDLSLEEVLLDDPFEHRRIAFPVPRALGIDDRNRPAFADPQAVGLRAEDAALIGEPQFLEAALQIVPGREPARLVATLRRGLIAAEEDVAPGD